MSRLLRSVSVMTFMAGAGIVAGVSAQEYDGAADGQSLLQQSGAFTEQNRGDFTAEELFGMPGDDSPASYGGNINHFVDDAERGIVGLEDERAANNGELPEDANDRAWLLMDGAARQSLDQRPDLSIDQDLMQPALGRPSDYLGEFAGCEANTITHTSTRTVHVEDLQTCNQIFQSEGAYQYGHDYTIIRPIRLISSSGGASLTQMGPEEWEITLGSPSSNTRTNGSCTTISDSITVEIGVTGGFVQATLEQVHVNDEVQVVIDGETVFDERAPQYCQARTVYWAAGGRTCAANAQDGNVGNTQRIVDEFDTNWGRADLVCNAAPGPVGEWQVASRTCGPQPTPEPEFDEDGEEIPVEVEPGPDLEPISPGAIAPCDTRTNKTFSPNKDVLSGFSEAGQVTVQLRNTYGGNGHAYARIRLRLDTSRHILETPYQGELDGEVEYDYAGPQGSGSGGVFDVTSNGDPAFRFNGYWTDKAVEMVRRIDSGWCEAEDINILDTPPLDAAGCSQLETLTVCPRHFSNVPAPGTMNPLIRKADVQAICTPHYGTFCWIDAQGQERCHTTDETNSSFDDCGPLIDQTNAGECSFQRHVCLDGATDKYGYCYLWENVFDCGEVETVTSTHTTQEYDCGASPIQCMGEDCVGDIEENAPPIENAMAMRNVPQFMSFDSNCSDPNDLSTCRFFAGERKTCKIAPAGIVNCCEEGSGQASIGSMLDGMFMILSMATGLSMEAQGQSTNAMGAATTPSGEIIGGDNASGSYNDHEGNPTGAGMGPTENGGWTPINPVQHGLWAMDGDEEMAVGNNYMPITSSLDSSSGSTPGTTSGDDPSAVYAQSQQDKINDTAQQYYSQFGNDAGNTMFTDIGGGNFKFNGNLAFTAAAGQPLLQMVMTTFISYEMIKILAQLIWPCSSEELELSRREQNDTCEYINQYCSKKIFLVGCVETKKAYCCFNSKLSANVYRAVRERNNRPLYHESGRHFQCEGITLDQINQSGLDIDMSPWIRHLEVGGHSLADKRGSASIDDVGSRARLEGVDADRVREGGKKAIEDYGRERRNRVESSATPSD